jgi:hypothetical protein
MKFVMFLFPITVWGGMWYSTSMNSRLSFSILTIHWATNGSISKFHFGVSS